VRAVNGGEGGGGGRGRVQREILLAGGQGKSPEGQLLAKHEVARIE